MSIAEHKRIMGRSHDLLEKDRRIVCGDHFEEAEEFRRGGVQGNRMWELWGELVLCQSGLIPLSLDGCYCGFDCIWFQEHQHF